MKSVPKVIKSSRLSTKFEDNSFKESNSQSKRSYHSSRRTFRDEERVKHRDRTPLKESKESRRRSPLKSLDNVRERSPFHKKIAHRNVPKIIDDRMLPIKFDLSAFENNQSGKHKSHHSSKSSSRYERTTTTKSRSRSPVKKINGFIGSSHLEKMDKASKSSSLLQEKIYKSSSPRQRVIERSESPTLETKIDTNKNAFNAFQNIVGNWKTMQINF